MAGSADLQSRTDERSKTDARPIREVSANTDWDRAIEQRRQVAKIVRSVLDEERIEALVIESADGNYPPWVQLEAWLPVAQPGGNFAGHERGWVQFALDVKPFNERAQVITATLKRGKKSLSVTSRPDFSARNIAEWTRYALDRGPKPSNYTPKLDALAALLHALLRFINEPHRNRIVKAYRTSFWRNSAALLTTAAFILFYLGLTSVAASPAFGVILFIAAGASLIAGIAVTLMRRNAVSVTSQPVVPPRNIVLVDSWHVVVAEFGRDYSSIKRRIGQAVTQSVGAGVLSQFEVYGYRAPNGYEERERLVVSKGQALVHVHMYSFGQDMFIGWDSFLNWAQWSETKPVSTRIEGRNEIEFRELRTGVYIPNQLDLIDLQSLSELVHRRIEREIKAILKEKAIDQEIDFKIIRGDRDRALDKERHKEQTGVKS